MISIATANRNANTGASTPTPGIVDHIAQIGRLSVPHSRWFQQRSSSLSSVLTNVSSGVTCPSSPRFSSGV